MELRGKKVVVVGLERTGEALAGFLLDEGARVTISEMKPASALGEAASRWAARGAVIEAGGHDPATFLGADLIVPSPGVPRLEAILQARARGVSVLSEIELAARFLQGTIIGITGTNGKSTTTTLLHEILRDAGFASRLAGNIGTPLLSFVRASLPSDIYVTEISSFQLEYIERFKVHIAVFLNITQNHLDWHGDFEAYYAAKRRLIAGLGSGDCAVLNADDLRVWSLRETGPFATAGFSARSDVERGAVVRDGWIVLRDGPGREDKLLPLSEIPLLGAHNRENVMAAALAAGFLGVGPAAIRKTVRGFRGLPHRLERVLTLGGVEFVNDSKATTVDAAIKALESFDRPVILILGGKDKGSDFAVLRETVARRVKAVVLIGSARAKIRFALAGLVPMTDAADYREAVAEARAAAAPGDVVLLAPACTSWDMFKNFEERGDTFKAEVRRLAAAERVKE